MKRVSILVMLLFSAAILLHGCGGDEQNESSGQATGSTPAEEVSQAMPLDDLEREAEQGVPVTAGKDKKPMKTQALAEEVAEVAERIGAPAETVTMTSPDSVSTAVEPAEQAVEKVAEAVNEADDKPYQVIDGQISDNVMEGWRTYNGGGCGACHGKGASGGVGPTLGESVTQRISKEQFFTIVTNGVSGTLMRPNKTNKRVMDNLENLYAYLVARGDGVLGPGNLIKFPMGKANRK